MLKSSLAVLLLTVALVYSKEDHTIPPEVLEQLFGTEPKGVQENTDIERQGGRVYRQAETEEKCTVKGQVGVCTKYYLCDNPISVLNADGKIDATLDADPCKNIIDLCCPSKNAEKKP